MNKTSGKFQHIGQLILLLIISYTSMVVSADSVMMAEQKLLFGLQSIQTLSMKSALQQFSDLSKKYPGYKLAQLLKADLLALKAGQKPLLDSIHSRHKKAIVKLIDEAVVRWNYSEPGFQSNPYFNHYVLKTANQSHLILVSLDENRLYLYERDKQGILNRVVDYYITIGRKGGGKQKEGDLRTPTGIYHTVDLLPGSQLPDLYGVGAMTLNYPNKWDKKHGRTGSGIWLHGTPRDTYIRAPKASRGCIVLNNNAMQKLLSEYQLPSATPVLIVDDMQSFFVINEDHSQILQEIKSWLNNHKVVANWQSVSVYRYPGESGLYYVTFPATTGHEFVYQYWQKEQNGRWQLVIQSQEPVQA